VVARSAARRGVQRIAGLEHRCAASQPEILRAEFVVLLKIRSELAGRGAMELSEVIASTGPPSRCISA
jgi:hypothetical protein